MSATAADALRLLQQGDAQGALQASRQVLAAQPRNARAYLAAGLALRVLGRPAESLESLRNAAGLEPGDAAAAFELGNALELLDRRAEALAHYERAVQLRPAFLPARYALGSALHRAHRAAEAEPHLAAAAAQPLEPRWLLDHAQALAELKRWDEAHAAYARATAMAPSDPAAQVARGRFHVARGELDAAAEAFAAACRLQPTRIDWPMYLAQVELLRGRWDAAWAGYRSREQRLRFEAQRRELGAPYAPPDLQSLAGNPLLLVQEQGLGDELFFLRLAGVLRQAGARLAYAGDARLLPLLARTGLFTSLRDIAREPPRADERVLLTGDLPAVVGDAHLFAPPLPIAPSDEASAAVLQRLRTAGPRPWIATTWRSGTPRAETLFKEVPLEALAAALRPLPGTLIALQRAPQEGELERLAALAGRAVHDARDLAEDLESTLALTALVDRYVAVSSTAMHLAASAGARADVLVPFPPEWRWRMAGDSPWFPGFRIHRQDRDRGWDLRL